MDKNIALNTNPLVKFLGKTQEEFTKADIIKYVEENGIQMINFRYAADDGRLKTLNFAIQSMEHLDELLTTGERVDGSSLFKNIGAGSSDLYVVPRYSTAFENPFSEYPALDMLCAYFDKDGNPMPHAPENILKKAHDVFKEKTGYTYQTMGELEYYVISDAEDIFEATDQKGYHESAPFNKWEEFRVEAMMAITRAGGNIKYSHSEVGNFTHDGRIFEQNEIEFLPVDVEKAADQVMIAKWILRNLAYKYGLTVTFAPKITVGKAGSGMHVHTRIMDGDKNVMVENGKLSDTAKKVIAGYLDLASSLTAFGNTNPTSYFRLVPHQEAPTNICWGDRNRSVLVRVPLGWANKVNMAAQVNPGSTFEEKDYSSKQTVEFRCPDGSANVYLLMAGLTVAARHGIEMENALEIAEKTYVDVNIFDDEHQDKVKELQQLPVNCWESSEMLLHHADIYTKYNVFSKEILEGLARQLKSFNDQTLRDDISCNKEKLLKLVQTYFHCG